MARGQGADAEHQHLAEHPIDPQPDACTSAGPRQGQTERVLLCATRTGRLAGHPKRSVSTEAESLLPAAEGSTMGTYVVLSLLTGARTEELRAVTWTQVDLDGDAARRTTGAAAHHGLAVRPCRRRHQDQEVAPHAWPAAPLRQRVTCAPNPPGSGPTPRRRRLAGQRPRLRLRGRHAAGRGERATRLPTDRGRRRARRQRLDAPRAATQLRLPARPTAGYPIEQISRLVGHSGTAVTDSSTASRSDRTSTTARPPWTASSSVRRRCHAVRHSAARPTTERPGGELPAEPLTRPFSGGRYWD